jgi:hypothetical protein
MSFRSKATGITVSMLCVFALYTPAYSDTETFNFSEFSTFGHENSGDGIGFKRLDSSSVEATLNPATEHCTRHPHLSVGQSIILDEGDNKGDYCKYTLKSVGPTSADFDTVCGINVVGIQKRCERELSEFPSSATLDQRVAIWRQQALLCDGAGHIVTSAAIPPGAFPTKEFSDLPLRNARPETCNDGDMLLFNGMLCAAGESVGCEAAKHSQDTGSGRFWRSPAIKSRGVENPDEPNINSD